MIPDPDTDAVAAAKQSARRGTLAAERVFVTYTQESPAHLERVKAFVRRLQAAGFSVSFDQDQPPGGPNLGWATWSQNEAELSPRVLAVFTATYEKCWRGYHPPGVRNGATSEAMALSNRCCAGGAEISFMRPVVFDDADGEFIPYRLRGIARFHGERDFGGIIRWLRGVPVIAPPAPATAAVPRIAPGTFRTGTPATDRYFVGRSREIRDLYVMLEKRQGCSILGDSCIGKSSLLLKWRDLARQQGHLANIVDFQKCAATHAGFLTAATGGAVSGAEGLDAETAADHLSRWAETQPKPPLVLVDESEEAIRALDYRFFERLRGMMGTVIIAFVSRKELSEVFADSKHGTSPFINLLETLKLGLLAEAEAQELADRAGEHAGILRLWAGRHPFYLQCLGADLERVGTDYTADEAINRFRDTAYQRLRETVQRYGPKAQKALAEAVSGLPADHYELKARGLLNADGTPFGRILVKWMEDRE